MAHDVRQDAVQHFGLVYRFLGDNIQHGEDGIGSLAEDGRPQAKSRGRRDVLLVERIHRSNVGGVILEIVEIDPDVLSDAFDWATFEELELRWSCDRHDGFGGMHERVVVGWRSLLEE